MFRLGSPLLLWFQTKADTHIVLWNWRNVADSVWAISDTETSTSRANSYRDQFESLYLFHGLRNAPSSYYIVFSPMKMVTLPVLEDVRRTIKEHCANLEKLFCSVCEENWKTKPIGKDTEADESIVQCEGTVLKVRTEKRVIPSKQWNADLHKLLKHSMGSKT